MTRRPDLFIVGAPKCGTTSLYNYLRGHPDVFLPRPKEPNFFAAERYANHRMRYPDDLERYLAIFAEAGDAQRVGEASTSYLESPEAPGRIRDFAPEARIVAMVRNPIDMMDSLHAMRVAQGVEPKIDFAEALADERSRAGFGIIGDQSSVRYRDRARYAAMLPRWFETFGRERVHVIVTEDLASDPRATFRSLLGFLELSADYEPESFRRYNTSQRARSPLLTRLAARVPYRPESRSAIDRLTAPAWRIVRRLNRQRRSRPPLDPELRRRLEDELTPDVELLGELLGRDLVALWWGRTVAVEAPAATPAAR